MTTTNDHGQRIGRPVEWGPRPRPEPVVLEGRGVRLEPLGAQHVEDLYAALCWLSPKPLREGAKVLVKQRAALDETLRIGGAFKGEVAVVALGKCGSREMTARSDLDLMTLYRAKPGEMYTQALVDGLRITLRAGGRTYEYHSGGNRPPALCDKPTE